MHDTRPSYDSSHNLGTTASNRPSGGYSERDNRPYDILHDTRPSGCSFPTSINYQDRFSSTTSVSPQLGVPDFDNHSEGNFDNAGIADFPEHHGDNSTQSGDPRDNVERSQPLPQLTPVELQRRTALASSEALQSSSGVLQDLLVVKQVTRPTVLAVAPTANDVLDLSNLPSNDNSPMFPERLWGYRRQKVLSAAVLLSLIVDRANDNCHLMKFGLGSNGGGRGNSGGRGGRRVESGNQFDDYDERNLRHYGSLHNLGITASYRPSGGYGERDNRPYDILHDPRPSGSPFPTSISYQARIALPTSASPLLGVPGFDNPSVGRFDNAGIDDSSEHHDDYSTQSGDPRDNVERSQVLPQLTPVELQRRTALASSGVDDKRGLWETTMPLNIVWSR